MFRRGGNWWLSLRGDWGILALELVTGCSVEKASIAPASTKTNRENVHFKHVIKIKTFLYLL